ncbi:glycosyltransferase family 76 protein [Coniophora puteana RWD-64-598 SS2]|uniref:GPI mannosyltransferase 2 n=1 Tax=Coniophora puteana (strain RWD-64-598) TaxID=741705 RepID=A0A5M3MVD4_CONPW|nr:glycosyltransferase family 76 protein [Coniophora puteana RWD-64-598 SS2]EIW82684.1 glycosyltransferase family 76 protein [Coniophora puteana RWD-64-598 SS2]
MSTTSQASVSKTEQHLRSLRFLSWSSRLLIWSLISASALLFPLFDASPKLVISDGDAWTTKGASALLRWDAFHFLHIADAGYVYEHEWAFFPGAPALMRLSGALLARVFGAVSSASPQNARLLAMMHGGALLGALLDARCGVLLYELTLHHFGSSGFAYVSALLGLVGSSPAALRYAAYTEPFFAYFSFKGMLCCARKRWVRAAACFACAGALRSNGVLLAGFVGWGMVGEVVVSGRGRELTPSRIAYAALLTALPFAPFVWHNYAAYVLFCASPSSREPTAEWCTRTIPSIYGYVQDRYWNVGFLRYWTLSNAPNFLLALPALVPVLAFCMSYLRGVARILLQPVPAQSKRNDTPSPSPLASLRAFFTDPHPRPTDPFIRPSLLPHVLHALALSLTLLFAAHTQIALRVLPTVPLAHWALAWALTRLPRRCGRVLLAWYVCWALCACVLWAVFLPPA